MLYRDDISYRSILTYFAGEALHGTIRILLSVAYDLLDRDAFAQILQVAQSLRDTPEAVFLNL